MYQDKIIRFLGAAREWVEAPTFEKLNLSLSTFLGDPKDCVLFSRNCNIEDMETEDDEKYVFSLPDRSVTETFSRFEVRRVFVKLNPAFGNERIDVMLKMAWDYPKIVINTKTTEFRPFSDANDGLPPIPPSGGPPIRQKFIDESKT